MSAQAAGRFTVPVDPVDQYGHTHHDPEVVERGLRTMRALRTGTFI
jgi:hypothetical protein